MMSLPFAIADNVSAALAAGRPVAALESTLIAHGLPWPVNFETARASDDAVRQAGAAPATIAVWQGVPTIGLSLAQIEDLAQSKSAVKASRRDLAAAIARGQTAATTVAATMFLAHRAGIRVMATGGIGGVHKEASDSFDISADLVELARTPVAVVCSGAKSILDLAKTLELLETLAVPVIGYRTSEFPAFYERSRGMPIPCRADSAEEIARIMRCHWELQGGGLIIAQAVPEEAALSNEEFAAALEVAEAGVDGLTGPAVTPALLANLAEATQGRSLNANRALIVANARLAGEIAKYWSNTV